MALDRIGYASQYTNGTWGPIFPTLELARKWANEKRAELDPARTVLDIHANLPDGPPRPVVLLASGERVRYNVQRQLFSVVSDGVPAVTFPRLVELVRRYDVQDSELDALQALPAQTAVWAAAGGRD